jgi:pyrimidine operon attenuation protein/uracil phosphoribosyltransferase
LDITFFRDDFRRNEKPLEANKTEIDFLVEDEQVIFSCSKLRIIKIIMF